MKNNAVAFALLDSSYAIPQHIQMLTFRNYANKNSLSLAFYGGELVGQEQKHLLFLSYLKDDCYDNFLFFSVRQFITTDNLLQKELIEMAIQQGKTLHFANENRKITNQEDVKKIILLTMSIGHKLWENGPYDLTLKSEIS